MNASYFLKNVTMSDAPTLEITLNCDRSAQPFRVQVPMEQCRQFLKRQQRKSETLEQLKACLVDADALPDLVLVYREKVILLHTVNPKYDATIGRLLNTVTKAEHFPVARRTRKQKLRNLR